MRIYALAAALLLSATLFACTKSSSDQSTSTSTTAPGSAATDSSAGGTTAATEAPKATGAAGGFAIYPGATLQAGGESSAGAMGTAAGKVYVTGDSYDKVAEWYKTHAPSGAQETHVSSAGTSSTVYVVGAGTGHQGSLTITSSPATQGKTWITVAEVKK